MKFHALALCVAGAVAACPVSAQETQQPAETQPQPMRPQTIAPQRGTQMQPETPAQPATPTEREMQMQREEQMRREAEMRRQDEMRRDTYGRMSEDGTFVRTEVWPYYRMNLYPDLPPVEEVAARVREIDMMNRREAAELRALAARAAAGGYQNIAAVYEFMARDHEQGAQLAENWLADNRFAVPPPPVVTVAEDVSPERSVDVMLQHHAQMFNEALERRKNEPSAAVRGLLLVNAATSLRHISLLRALDRDVDFGRRTASAYLRGLMDDRTLAAADETWITTVMREDEEYFRSIAPPPTVVTIVPVQPQPPAVTPPAPQPVVVERVIERVVEKPVIVERIVERPVMVPAPRAEVAGRRQTIRARGRRPAK